ncbi:OmpP1/FadL family transporter [Maribacter polysaccharolyticus]|uniref:OmpP1/FadL family transporter n=1 Tax=Maribacter polysaccharolyticus TaxID=3020831 RepID=UPI00237FB9F8|nr:hypothetical protein [Maribacter polysaccharolyticus]MDE3742001.1 hypothetical protein [Maribacter polysaccharolyticus]
MKMNKTPYFILAVILLALNSITAQSEALTSSPYSLYGLGVINQSSIGFTNGLGYTGIGIGTDTQINNLNAANYGLIPANSFYYDVGIRGGYNTYSSSTDNESKTTLNFADLAVAFRITEGLGMGITMVPYTDVGYTLVGLETNIEGSTETFESNVSGLGGLSDLKLNIGYAVTDILRFGLSTSFLFGNIEEQEYFVISSSALSTSEETNYSGFRVGLGMQFDITDKITMGSTMQLPSSLKGNLTRTVVKYLDGSEITVEDDESDTVDDFDMPLEVGIGFSARVMESLTLSADYKKNYWSKTGQEENLGKYEDQDIVSFGAEYVNNPTSFKYADRIRYRAGFNYDNGYLAVNGIKVDSYNITAGIGLPIGQGLRSLMNLSYSYGAKGQIENILVKENYHLLTLNLSFADLWFQKRLIN